MEKNNNGIYGKLFNVQANVGRLKKDKTNPHFKNSYVDVNSVLEETLPVLNEEKVLLLQPTEVKNGVNYLYTKLVDIEDGSRVEASMILPNGLDAQKTGSALTYYRRYMLVSILGLQAVDDDGKAGSNPIKDNKKPTEEMILELEGFFNGNVEFRTQWLQYLKVERFELSTFGQIEKAIKQLRKGA